MTEEQAPEDAPIVVDVSPESLDWFAITARGGWGDPAVKKYSEGQLRGWTPDEVLAGIAERTHGCV